MPVKTPTPQAIVEDLNRYIIGQDDAKRAMAIALRTRYRREQLPAEIREEIIPKNILMIGPTGVGKTEIARRLARMLEAPFVKVEATKFTEVGYVGRDVESIVRDLVEAAIRQQKELMLKAVEEKAADAAEDRLVDLLTDEGKRRAPNPLEALLNMTPKTPEPSEEERQRLSTKRSEVRERLRSGELEKTEVTILVDDVAVGSMQTMPGTDVSMQDVLGSVLPPKKKERRVTVAEARRILTAEEAGKLIDMDAVIQLAIDNAEQNGIVFIDEIDKVAGRGSGSGGGPDVSREGVQRDILPIVEGSTVITKYGPIKTDYILFIAAGAFHVSKVSDLIPELQGRFPVRVELKPLTRDDFRRILVQPENALIKQYQALLAVDHVDLQIEDTGIDALADIAYRMNLSSENIGARRLHTVLEGLLEDISFHANGEHPMTTVRIDDAYVREHLEPTMKDQDMSKYIL